MVLAVAVSFIDVPSNSDIGQDFPTKYLPTCPTPSSSSSSRTPSSLSSSKLSLSLLSKEHGHDYLVMFLSRLEMFFFHPVLFLFQHTGTKNQIPNYFYRERTQKWKVNYHLAICEKTFYIRPLKLVFLFFLLC